MDISTLSQTGSRALGRSLLVTKKYAPEILTSVGVVGVVTAAVLGARATLKLEPIVDAINMDLNEIALQEAHDNASDNAEVKVVYTKDRVRTYVLGGLEVAKIYGPAVSIGAGSIGCILAAHGIMRQRNAALIAAYNVVAHSFNEYRKRVVEEYGADKDRDFAHGIVRKTVTSETGDTYEEVSKKEGFKSEYARFFDEYANEWQKDAEYNLYFLKCQQQYANDLLRSRGHVFLNEIYDALGIPRSRAGAVVGWVLSKDGDTANFIDFGMYDLRSPDARAFINGLERSILLDFNVDGVIIDKIE